MNNFVEKFQPVWKNLSAVFKLTIAIILTAGYLAVNYKLAPSSLANPANLILLFVISLYMAWQLMWAYWQIKDIRMNYLMLKKLKHHLGSKSTLAKPLYLAIITDFDSLAKEYEASLYVDLAKAEQEHEEALAFLRRVNNYQELLNNSFKNNLVVWKKAQAELKAKLQNALDIDISYVKAHAKILGKLAKQIAKQRKRLLALQKKTVWPEAKYYEYITCLYYVIPKEVSHEELMSKSEARLELESFWQEYNQQALPKEVVKELVVFLKMIAEANALLANHQAN